MAIVINPTYPHDEDINVPLDTDISFTVRDSSSTINLNTLDVSIDDGGGAVNAIVNGVFSNNYTGEIVDLDPGFNNFYFVVITNPISSPTFPMNGNIEAQISVDNGVPVTGNLTINFMTEAFGISSSFLYTETMNLSSLPSGWSTQSSGTGSAPTFGSGQMITSTGASGNSYIDKTSYGLDFDTGFLVDIFFDTNLRTGIAKFLEVFKGGSGLVSARIDFDNKRVWLENVEGQRASNFRPYYNDPNEKLWFRLSIKNSGDNLIARLFGADYVAETQIPIIQTLGPSALLGTTEDYIRIGSIDVGDAFIVVDEPILIQNGINPDYYYSFSSIESVTPLTDTIDGGTRLNVNLDRDIDIDIGSNVFANLNRVLDTSTGTGSIAGTASGLKLTVTNAGAGEASGILTPTYSGNKPNGISTSMKLVADNSIIASPPSTEVIIGGIELSSVDRKLTIELKSNSNDGNYFDVNIISGSSVLFSSLIENIISQSHIIKINRWGTKISVFINNQEIINTSFVDGEGILRAYSKSTVGIDVVSYISYITARPVIAIGNYFTEIIDLNDLKTKFIRATIPESIETGEASIILAGIHGNGTIIDQFEYTKPIQEKTLSSANGIVLSAIDRILKDET